LLKIYFKYLFKTVSRNSYLLQQNFSAQNKNYYKQYIILSFQDFICHCLVVLKVCCYFYGTHKNRTAKEYVTYHGGEYFVRVELRLQSVDGAKTGDERAADTGHSDLAECQSGLGLVGADLHPD
jgi:hypothetical protein